MEVELLLIAIMLLLQILNLVIWGRSNGRTKADINDLLDKYVDRLRKQAERLEDSGRTGQAEQPLNIWSHLEREMKNKGVL